MSVIRGRSVALSTGDQLCLHANVFGGHASFCECAQTHEVVPSAPEVVNLREAGVSAGQVLDRSRSTRVSVTFRAYAGDSEVTDA